MNLNQLKSQIKSKQSFLCVGLDPDKSKIGYKTKLEFCKDIIDQTIDYTVSYKINTAFFESDGSKGWEEMEYLFDYLQNKDVFIIADAKRGDIGSTSTHYAKSLYDNLKSHGVTLNPLMGKDSLQPFLDRENKVSIFLGLTSNPDSNQFFMKDIGGQKFYEMMIRETKSWESSSEKMWVVGATNKEEFNTIKKLIKNDFLLIPGVGHQGGDLEEVIEGLLTDDNLLINLSRSIIFSDNPNLESKKIQEKMKKYF
jgi:orotidine-5'-phosphate decarboxylase